MEGQNPEELAINAEQYGKMQYTIDYYIECAGTITHMF